ncbi:cyclodeaminase/cyclohydrolase family protein [Clostridium malenominatum]|uniref:Cyclodeaminase/cyclohydrolase family protein n=1 Tax=Clostridium malenominatum TaxID=1539 RepID=A0ABN1IZM0_9CLOT
MNYIDVLNKILDTKDFTVGGGSASAIAGAMAAGLIGMVSRLSTKKDYGLSERGYLFIADRAEELSKKLLEGAVKDTESFKKIKDAYALPKDTDEEKKIRSLAIQNAAIGAANVPLENGLLCKEVYNSWVLLKGKSNPNASSDLEEARFLVHAGVLGCVLNIEANLPLIKDENVKENFQKEIELLKKYSEE